IAIWDSIGDYGSEPIDDDDHRAHAQAVAAVVYNTATIEGWPSQTTGRSIFLNNLSASPNDGSSWTKAGTAADMLGSVNATQFSELAVDHPGGDVGSPGYAPGTVQTALLGDYNGNHVIDAADYTVWRDRMGSGGSLPNDASPGTVDVGDYNYWKSHFGQTGGSGGIAAVPEPASGVLLLIAMLIQPSHRSEKRHQQWR
ncbi:MAG: hypothetical protein WD971_12805, partial [Pirellulales bacterium]